ncbi:MAG: hypothetical protein SFX73_12770 [Kofleriaceae bacterium]|nr:hypothetical protein [Kofleriaceae bacterium]
MTSALRPELLTPTPPYVWRLLLGSVIGSVGAVVMAIGYQARSEPRVAIALREAAMEAAPEPEGIARETTPPGTVGELAMVFEVDGVAYMKLEDLEALPPHGEPRLVKSNVWVTAAISPVDADDLRLTHRAWKGKPVLVDGTCPATVQEFAVISRLVGTPDYAGLSTGQWTASSVMKAGDRVLAARLDDCHDGRFARDAGLSPVVVPDVISDEPLERAAKRAMLASPEVLAAQAAWMKNPPDGDATHWTKAAGTVITTRVVRHPTTGTTWVSVQGRFDGGCGLANLNVWKLYRADADGKLTAVPTSLDEQSTAIEQFVDVEGDGELEVITTAWGGLGRNVNRASGQSLARDHWQFFGCAC